MGYVLRILGMQDFDAGTGYLLKVVDLHYLVMVVPNYELPSATSLPAPWGGGALPLICAPAARTFFAVCLSWGVSRLLPPHRGRPWLAPGFEVPGVE